MKYFYVLALFVQGAVCYSQLDTNRSQKKITPFVSMEIENLSIGYGSPHTNAKRSLSYRSSMIFNYCQPIYLNYTLEPVIGYYHYYYYDKHVTKDKYISKGLYYGLAVSKRFVLNTKSSLGISIQNVFYDQKDQYQRGPVQSEYYNFWRLRLSGNSNFYKRLGFTCSLNLVAYTEPKNYFISDIGIYRDINFSFGLTYELKK